MRSNLKPKWPNRRNFMGMWWFALLGVTSQITTATKALANTIVVNDSGEEISEVLRGMNSVWSDEFETFAHVYGVEMWDQRGLFEKIKEVQRSLGLTDDGIFGPTTLKHLYTRVYFGGSNPYFWSFIREIAQYDKFDNFPEHGEMPGNPQRFHAIAEPLIREWLSGINLSKIRYIIYKELLDAYTTRNNPHYNGYDAEKIFRSKDFFWELGNVRTYISSKKQTIDTWEEVITHYDNRLSGNVNFLDTTPLFVSLWKEDQATENAAFVIRDPNNNYVFMYYERDRLKYFCPASPWSVALGTTPDEGLEVADYSDVWHFYNRDEYKAFLANDWSPSDWEGNRGGPMPFSRRLLKDGAIKWYYTHIGRVTGKEASHGCIRLPALWAYIMFYDLETETPVIYSPTKKLVW